MGAHMSVGSPEPETMIITVTETGLVWKDQDGTEHRAEQLMASTYAGGNRIQIHRNGELLASGSFNHVGTHGSYDAWYGLEDAIGDNYSPVLYPSKLCPGDQILIEAVPVHMQGRLWEDMKIPR